MSYNFITESTYSIVEKADSDFYSFRINEGDYKGVVYSYGKVKFVEQADKPGHATLKFTFKMEEIPPHLDRKIEEYVDFKNFLGDVLSHYIYANQENFLIGNNNAEAGNSNSK